MLRPLVLGNMAETAPCWSPERLLFSPPSTRYLQLCHRKRCGPSRGEWLLQATKLQNSDASTVQANPTHNVPLQQDHVQSGREFRYNAKSRLMPAYHSALSLPLSL